MSWIKAILNAMRGHRTVFTVSTGIVLALVATANGEMAPGQCLAACITGAALIFGRYGLTNAIAGVIKEISASNGKD